MTGVKLTMADARHEHALQLAEQLWPAKPERIVAGKPERKWYVVQTEPQRENTAAAYLVARKFKHYLPIILVEVQAGRSRQRRARPMFPGYVFVHLDLDRDPFDRIRDLPGVQSGRNAFLHGEGENLASVRDEEMALVRGWEKEITLEPPVFSWELQKGQAVVVTKGPFAGHEARIETLDDQGRITLLMSLLGRTTPMQLDRSFIEAI